MIGLLASQVLAILGCALLLGVPGWALSRLLEAHLRVPPILLPVVFSTLGLGVWTIVLLPALALGWPIRTTLVVHGAVSVVLVVLARLRERRRGHAKLGSDVVCAWTLAAVALASVAALALRTRMAFDSLFHLGLVRRLLELESPTFDELDRVVGSGINPAYVVPTWQAAMAGVSALTGLDPATVLEAMAVVAVLLAACAAAALGRVVTGTVAGEVAGAAAYAWMRVFFPRRELEGDGVAYAALPGNVALDVLLPVALVAALLVVRRRRGQPLLPALVLGATAVALLGVLHANYLVYLAIIGVGTVAWLAVTERWSGDLARRVGVATAMLAAPALVVLAALLPLLATLQHFGAPVEPRIDYHLLRLGETQLVRPGHLYDAFGVPGLLALLVLPWAAWRARGVERALLGGGSLALLAFALVPPLVELLGATGSLTLSLRLPRALGLLLVAAAAVALPDLLGRVQVAAVRAGIRGGPALARAVRLAPLLAVAIVAWAYGYPLARREPAEYGWNWPTGVAAVGLLVVLMLAVRRRARGAAPLLERRDAAAAASARSVGLAALLLAVTMLPSGHMSMRRAAWQAREVVAAWRADDLRCFDGIDGALRALPPGSVLLTDPVTAYGAQALAPVRVVADYKVWNGSTDPERIERRIQLLDATFDSKVGERAGAGLARLSEDHGARYVLVSRGEVEPPLGSELDPYDARGLRALLRSGEIGARRVAEGEGRFAADADASDRAACELELWRLDGSERRLELHRDAHHDGDPHA